METEKMNQLEEEKERLNSYLKECNNSEYLKITIFPLLKLALEHVDLYRPTDPINHIALFMLKNKNLVIAENEE